VGYIGFLLQRAQIDGPDGVKHEVPYYLMLLGGTYQEFGVAVQSIPARLAPVAVGRVLEHFKQNRQEGESFRATCCVARWRLSIQQLTCGSDQAADGRPRDVRDLGRRDRVQPEPRPRRVRRVESGGGQNSPARAEWERRRGYSLRRIVFFAVVTRV